MFLTQLLILPHTSFSLSFKILRRLFSARHSRLLVVRPVEQPRAAGGEGLAVEAVAVILEAEGAVVGREGALGALGQFPSIFND